jgi:uncharacterized membrane protein
MSAAERPGAEFGPVQMLVLGCDQARFTGEILPELRRLTDEGLVRLVDLLVVTKKDGEIVSLQASDLPPDEATAFGALIGALIGLGAEGEDGAMAGAIAGAAALEDGHVLGEEDAWFLADAIPDDAWAAIALIEHRWAIPLRDKIVSAGAFPLADEWIHPADLVALGTELTDRFSSGVAS